MGSPPRSGPRSRPRFLPKTVLITGASSGIGAACATRLAAKGWEVHAGVRTPGDAPPATTEVILDVTDPPPLEFEQLDGLVNNAGIAIAAPLEDLPLDELRRQLEVNVVGQLAVTQAVLPALRAAKGRIVIVGSIAGRSALPFLGAYAISKFALEAMSDSLRLELAPDGIEVSLVEPGTIRTAIWTKPQPLAEVVSERYRARVERFRQIAAARAAKAAPVDLVSDAIEHALTAERPKTRYIVGRDAKIRARIEKLPDRARDRVLTRALLKD
jgi:NAD(P)-dependent dehydrogenase (short-subunit alcohol dehydrogenase family)